MGPTATGKTRLAIELASRLDGEIVSVDSRQAYRGLEVGTAAPTPGERRAARHHGVAFLSPDERYGAGRFARLAREWIADIRARGRVPILAGGTGFFLSALTDPVFREPPMDEDRREALRAWLEARPLPEVRRWVRRLDPGLDERLDTLDLQRCSRTLELALFAGRPLTWWHEHGEPEAEPVRARVFVLELPAGEHRERIRQRIRGMLDAGWKEEVTRLREAGYTDDDPAFSALGYRTVARMMRGEIEREAAIREIARETWAYARRQRTWFRHQVPDAAVRLDARRPTEQLADRVELVLERGREEAAR